MILALTITATALKDQRIRTAMAAGLSWGLAAYFRPHALPIASVVLLFLLQRAGWRHATAFALAMASMMLPWVARNEIAFGRPILLATEGGETFLGANNPYAVSSIKYKGMWISPMSIAEYRDRFRPIREESVRSRAQYAVAFEYLRSNPARIPRLVTDKLWRWLTPVTATGGSIRWIIMASYGTLLILLLVGSIRRWTGVIADPNASGTVRGDDPRWIALRSRSRIGELSPEFLLVGSTTLVFALITAVYWGGLTRGRVPLEILWLPWAVCGFARVQGFEVPTREVIGDPIEVLDRPVIRV